MYDAFLSIFKARHPDYEPDQDLSLRILLLKLTTLFTQRLTRNPTTPTRDALQSLRKQNQTRAQSWIETEDRLPSTGFNFQLLEEDLLLSQQELERNRAHVLHELGIPAEDEGYEDAFYGTSSCVSLLDILPLFMQVSAARNGMSGSNLTDFWMQMACGFMLQACLEQYLVFGSRGTDAVDEAFAWGYKDDHSNDMEIEGGGEERTSSVKEINEMFEDEDYATEVEGWSSIKTRHLERLLPFLTEVGSGIISEGKTEADKSDTVAHFEALAAKFPVSSFEVLLLKFLDALFKSISKPVLVQLENGKLDNMTEEETRDFLVECGIDLEKVLGPLIGLTGNSD